MNKVQSSGLSALTLTIRTRRQVAKVRPGRRVSACAWSNWAMPFPTG